MMVGVYEGGSARCLVRGGGGLTIVIMVLMTGQAFLNKGKTNTLFRK